MLNELLYRQLCTFCAANGSRPPKIKAENESISWRLQTEFIPGESPRLTRFVNSPGEEYELDCPFCGDKRCRLSINHRFGVYDPDTDSVNLWLAHCYNENCLADRENQISLHFRLFTGSPPVQASQLKEGIKTSSVMSEQPWPGAVIRLDKLMVNDPGHKAIQYMQSRGYNPAVLGQSYDFSYCGLSHMKFASDRIIMPIYRSHVLVGWQARYIGDTVNGIPLKDTGIPKYYTSPGFSSGKWSFNFEEAIRHNCIVITEGMLDAISTGPCAIAVFGKSVSKTMCSRIVFEMQSRGGGAIVVMLDGQIDESERRRGAIHHIKKTAKQFIGCGLPISEVYLKSDPGSTPREEIWEEIISQSNAQGVRVDSRRRRVF